MELSPLSSKEVCQWAHDHGIYGLYCTPETAILMSKKKDFEGEMPFWKWYSEVMGFHASILQDAANILKQLSFYGAGSPVGKKCWYRNQRMKIEVFHLLSFPKWGIHASCLHSIRLCGARVPGCLRKTLPPGKRVTVPVNFNLWLPPGDGISLCHRIVSSY